MRTVDPESNAARRQAILDSAAQCFAASGFRATRTADICKGAAMSSGNMFHYFPSKHSVLCALVEREGVETARWMDELGATDDPLGALRVFLSAVCDLAADPIFAGLSLEVSAIAHRDETVARLVRENDASLRRGVTNLVVRAERAGQISTTLSAEAVATWIAALVDGTFARCAVQPEFAPKSEAMTLVHIVDQVLVAGDRS